MQVMVMGKVDPGSCLDPKALFFMADLAYVALFQLPVLSQVLCACVTHSAASIILHQSELRPSLTVQCAWIASGD